MKVSRFSIFPFLFSVALPATAQDVFTNGVTISDGNTSIADLFVSGRTVLDGQTCIGAGCDIGETFGQYLLKLKEGRTSILFDDTTGDPDYSSNDWQITVNEAAQFGLDKFAIEDITGGTVPFTIEGGAPSNALYVDDAGRIGIGTSFPTHDLDIFRIQSDIKIRLDGYDDSFGFWDWRVVADPYSVSFTSTESSNPSVSFSTRAYSLVSDNVGNLGVGTATPEGKLHTLGNGTQLAYFESVDGGAVQVRFRTDSQNRRFLAVNNADEVQTQMQFRDNEILFLGQTVADEWPKVDATGITTAGPTCNPNPCDATFDPNAFEVPAIEERAALMWEQKHLPAIGPTTPGEAINLTEKTGGIIHELEVAHIYIEQLHDRLAQQESDNGALLAHIAQQDARLDSLEAMVGTLTRK